MEFSWTDVERLCRVAAKGRVRLDDYDPGWRGSDELQELGEKKLKRRAATFLAENLGRLTDAQERLWAGNRYAVLLIFQAMDAAGKDSTIKHVMSGVNPQGCRVVSFKQPSETELRHTFLWRCSRELPERGQIGIFNRSYYEEVLVVRVHPALLERQQLTPGERGKSFWADRYEDINNFERHLARNGTVVLKFFLHLSPAEQRQRFLARIDDPRKQWKFSRADLAERAHWAAYQAAYEEALTATSTPWAPWYVIPADHKFITRSLVAFIITETIIRLDLGYPQVTAAQQVMLAEARQRLLSEAASE